MFSTTRIATSAGLSRDSLRFFPRVRYPNPLKTRSFSIDIIHDSLWNKEMAFSRSERDRLGFSFAGNTGRDGETVLPACANSDAVIVELKADNDKMTNDLDYLGIVID